MAQEASSSTQSKMISLKTADGKLFETEVAIAKQMKLVKDYLDDNVDVATFPLLNVFSKELPKIIEYCGKLINKEITKDFEDGFVKEMSNEDVKDLFLAANYVEMDSLFKFLSQVIANRIANESVEYVREYFGIENDFTPEEEAKLREENAWAFKGIEEDDN